MKNQKNQSDKFKEAAKELGCDDDEKRFNETVKKLAKSGSKKDDPKDEEFWLFKAPPLKRARIHKGSCPNCNYGKGQAMQIKKPDGPTSWTGFSSLSEAQEAMTALKYTDTELCGTCLR